MQHRVGCVPYVNARPLAYALDQDPEVEVRYEVPSRLPQLLDSEAAEAVLVSSYDALVTPGRTAAAGVGIISDGEVESVRLFSRVPPSEIKTLALDRSSLTSNRLAQVILHDRYRVCPELAVEEPNLAAMLSRNDACVLIGDIGMETESQGLHVLDLGLEWTDLTGLPFVWALWVGRENLSPSLVAKLQAALMNSGLSRRRWDPARQAEIVQDAAARSGWTPDRVRNYLTRSICYDLGEREAEGLREFQLRLQRLGLPAGSFPRIVEATPAQV
jgi:chorismate dehydratase